MMLRVLACFYLCLIWAHCQSGKNHVSEPIFKVGGFLDDDTLIVYGDGKSVDTFAGRKIAQEADATQKAKSDARSKFIEICHGANVAGCGSIPAVDWELKALAKNGMRQIQKKCVAATPPEDATECRLFFEIRHAGLKSRCEKSGIPAGCGGY